MKTVAFIPILTKDYYNVPKLYRFMSSEIFDSLEAAFLNGSDTALVPEADFLKMITEIELNNGIKSN